jgi:hypothetical protein
MHTGIGNRRYYYYYQYKTEKRDREGAS